MWEISFFKSHKRHDERGVRMPGPKVVLTFYKERCKEVMIKGEPFVQIDTDMTADELIGVLLKWAVSDDKVGVVLKEGDE